MSERIVVCPYCGANAECVDGTVMYPHRADLASKRFYRCVPCNAHVGCHERNGKPFGPLANAATRSARMRAHNAFDPIWKSQMMTRGDAYFWLARELGVTKGQVHIGQSDVETCNRIVEICRKRNAARL